MHRLACLLLLSACSSATHARPPVDEHDGSVAGRDAGHAASDAGNVESPRDATTVDAQADAASDSGTHDAATPLACPNATSGKKVGTLASDQLTETSGLVASRKNPGALWVHNDSGDSARIFAIDGTGKLLLELTISGAQATDWEDITARGDFIYIGDIGDNNKARTSVQLYRVSEPVLTAGTTKASAPAKRLDVTYEDGAHDAETLLADPLSGDLFIVAKAGIFEVGALVPVYRVPAAAFDSDKVTAKRVAMVPMGPATSGDILPDGSGIALRNYTSIRYWPRADDQTVQQALAGSSCTLPLSEGFAQGEALGFAADQSGYFTTIEGKNAPLYFYALENP